MCNINPFKTQTCALLLAMLCVAVTSNAQINLSNEYYEVSSLSGATVEMHGQSELHITGVGTPVSGSTINMHSEDSWVFLHEVKRKLMYCFSITNTPLLQINREI